MLQFTEVGTITFWPKCEGFGVDSVFIKLRVDEWILTSHWKGTDLTGCLFSRFDHGCCKPIVFWLLLCSLSFGGTQAITRYWRET